MKPGVFNTLLLMARRLTFFAFVIAGIHNWPAQAGIVLDIDVGSNPLLPGTSGQTLDFYIDNTGDTSLQASGLTFVLQLVGGGSSTGPSITAVDVLTGTPWQNLTLLANPQSQSPALWDLRFVDISGGYAELGAGSHTKIATVTFDTTGFESGSWVLSFEGTKYNQFSTGSEFLPDPDSINGQINLAPVPEPVNLALPIFGGLVAMIGGWRCCWRRKTST